MEKVWKFVCLCLVVSFLKLCNGLPIHLESAIPETSTQLLSEVIVILLTVCTVLLLVGCLCCHRPNGFKEFRDSPVAISTISNADNGLVNPSADGAFTIFAPLGHGDFSSSNDRLRLEEEYSYGDINVSSWFNEGEYDFPRTRLKYIKELGKGWFGSVVEGTAQDPKNNTWTSVVVRILDSTASTKEKVFFLHEAEIYKSGNHTNILKLHGRCLDSEPFLLLQELCPQGDLKGYLLSNRTNNNLLASEYPLVWCCQITSALKFLHEKGLAHSDLACRNCQLTSNLTLKLGDYGLASSKYPEDYYEGIPTISVRWCAPESIRHTSTTIQPERITREANIWSLAVCFWEICECGSRPYSDLTDDEVVTQVLGKVHAQLARPSHIVLYTDYIYRLMQSCWLTPESRPTSTQIYLTLTDLLQVFTVCKSEKGSSGDLQGSQESFDMRWNSLKPNITAISATVSTGRNDTKPTSPSMNNLIGSLEDMNRSRTSEEDNAQSVLLPVKSKQKFEFELSTQAKEPLETDSLDDSLVYNMRRSSSSETEEENWKRKIERGAYTEKVRQKSRSVTDLMILTHIDCSESESETPQPSLDHRVNYKNVRLAPKHNLESANYVHGSEGNLLSVQDDFQAELRKLQEEHRDSLFFVPDKYSQTLRNEQVNNNLGIDRNINIGDSSNGRFISELSSTSEITPVNQVYNVFNVTIDNLSPIHVVKLNEIINLEESLEFGENKTFVAYEVPKLCDIIQNNSMVANFPEDDLYHYDMHEIDNQIQDYKTTTLCYDIPSNNIDCDETSHSLCEEEDRNITDPMQNLNKISEYQEISQQTSCDEQALVINKQIESEPGPSNNESCTIKQEAIVVTSSPLEINETEPNHSEAVEIETNRTNSQCKNVSEHSLKSIENIKIMANVDETINFKTEESHSQHEEYCEIKMDEKNNVVCVPDNEPICDESVLNKKILDLQNIDKVSIPAENHLESTFNCNDDGIINSKKNIDKEKETINPSSTCNELQNNLNTLEHDIRIDQLNSWKTNDPLEFCETHHKTFINNDENITNNIRDLMNVEGNGPNKDNSNLNSQNLGSPENDSIEKTEFTEASSSVLDSLESNDTEKKEENEEVDCKLLVNEQNKTEQHQSATDSNCDSLKINHLQTKGRDEDIKENIEPEIESHYYLRKDDSTDTTYELEIVNQSEDKEEPNLKKTFAVEKKEIGDCKKFCQNDPTTAMEAKSFRVPKLIDLIENNDKLMDYIITNYETKFNDDSSLENNCKSGILEENNAVDGQQENHEEGDYPIVAFDLSDSQEASNPNSLTHLNVFSTSRTKQKSIDVVASTPLKKSRDSVEENQDESTNLDYSLETWDNFLENAIETQTRDINDHNIVFESLNSEPQSMIFIEGEGVNLTVTPPNSDMEISLEGDFLEDVYNNQTINIERNGDGLNATSEVEESNRTICIQDDDNLNNTYDVEEINKTYDASTLEGSLSMDDSAMDEQDVSGTWESNGGWFLHPQSSSSLSGQITEQKDVKNSDRFGMDDEILAALRGELLAKLPHAQGSTIDQLNENDEEWNASEREEVLLRYNVYNTPLSPIPEEYENEEDSDYVCTATGSPASGASDDWPEKLLENVAPQENDSQSLKTQGLHHQQTLSQDSCCSNDTLFNLEDMTYVVADQEEKSDSSEVQNEEDKLKKLEEEQIKKEAIDYFRLGTAVGMPMESPVTEMESPMEPSIDKTHLADFLLREREHSEMVSVVVTEPVCENPSESNSSQSVMLNKTAAPLPSPDDHPWKQLSDSLLKKGGLMETDRTYEDMDVEKEEDEEAEASIDSFVGAEVEVDSSQPSVYVQNEEELPSYVNVGNLESGDTVLYENIGGVCDKLNEVDYVNITNLENTKISAGFGKAEHLNEAENIDYVEVDDCLIIRNGEEEQDDQLYGVLTDIRFSGPGEPHLMSTSFSESNDIQNEQDWESGSDTRSSSSGEFIWRLDDIEPNQENKEETSSESSCSDEDGECPEFIPSAWDKYATPTKSALRSPEKTLEREEKKKGVWFKKQRYHCVYEYPREPDSPVLQSFDLWNNTPPATSYPEWYFDIDPNTEFNEFTTTTNFSDGDTLTTDFNTSFNNEFFVTGSATPFDMMSSTSSQFFPGGDHWSELSKLTENTTPDSGVEDVTPGSLDRVDFSSMVPASTVPSLKMLAEAVCTRFKQKNKENMSNEILGGLRHTRDKLKLDLPTSPNTFTSNKTFNLEPNIEPVVLRERPAFTTFGKSRFLVQHVDTPDKEVIGRNVCFEALPYKPLDKKDPDSKPKKVKKEQEKGEASLLDSADEDSGIESSTLERKSSDVVKLIVDL